MSAFFYVYVHKSDTLELLGAHASDLSGKKSGMSKYVADMFVFL